MTVVRAAALFACASASPAAAQSANWNSLPKMVIERQYAGPLADTVIQRLRDPVDGTVCYAYLPISVAHAPANASGFLQYNSNAIGTISCMAGPRPVARRAAP